MKKQILLLLVVSLMFSCSNDEDNLETELIGKWKLIEVLADPGDGSGTFEPVRSNKTIEFKSDGTLTTNNSLCDPYSDEMISSGTYKNNTITTGCQNPNIATISFELKNQYLILNFISNEGYSQKFEKIN
ncbi:hypothetical protein [Tenacibaculum singaporense]|uniref:hypothetical protein n=1 Tax=Tenacibaculum singaporense TaxID=2358479 RepID=UPI000F679478|nr:hypothetical protein [Tenacibaculum singaporense]RSC95008.1 hypothetical protein EI424_04995 [Tenacibaculum singaporense]